MQGDFAMKREPDFYLYEGDGNQEVLSEIRACWTEKWIEEDGRPMLIVKIDPPIKKGVLRYPESLLDTLGFTSRSSIPIKTQLKQNDFSSVVVYEIILDKDGIYQAPYSVGISTLYKKRPNIRPDGTMIWPPVPDSKI